MRPRTTDTQKLLEHLAHNQYTEDDGGQREYRCGWNDATRDLIRYVIELQQQDEKSRRERVAAFVEAG